MSRRGTPSSTSAWKAACKRQFEVLDLDGSGYIDEEELYSVFSLLDGKWTHERVRALFEAMDVNGDGKIEYSELVDWLACARNDVAASIAISFDDSSALDSFLRVAEGWSERVGQTPGTRGVIAGQFEPRPQELEGAEFSVTLTSMSGNCEVLQGVKGELPLKQLMNQVEFLLGFKPNTTQLLLGDRVLGADDENKTLASLGVRAGCHVMCVPLPKQVKEKPESEWLDDYDLLPRVIYECESFFELAVRHRKDGAYFTLCLKPKNTLKMLSLVNKVHREKNALLDLNHPNIMNLHWTFQDDTNLYYLFDYCPGGNLYTRLKTVGKFEDHVARFYCANIILAFEYLHSRDYVYRNLKPEHVAIAADGYLKLHDFTFVVRVPEKGSTSSVVGTPEYLAPEVILRKGHGRKLDSWTLGVLVYELLRGTCPFTDTTPAAIYKRILAGRIDVPVFFSKQARKVILRDCVVLDVSMRKQVSSVSRSRWFQGINWNDMLAKALPAPWVPALKRPEDLQHHEKYEAQCSHDDHPLSGPDPFACW
eukprot:TRINITY_DN25129_c0_g1_i1.p1 TRINITY_DN25129_c0_g1~~TRINITY_DN25129_c0_g1_i1.p1  ORF type:complete len:571 (+),score=98.67 TRINITY_DN25129_c0_g1_i1:106-1713(+)